MRIPETAALRAATSTTIREEYGLHFNFCKLEKFNAAFLSSEVPK
jgi:hypothetical protein